MPQQQHPDSISNGMMKKILLASLFFLFLGLVPHALAQQSFVPLAPIPGLTDIQPTEGELASFFNNLYKYLIGLAATLAVIEIIWGGLEISTQDSISKQSEGKKRIQEAITGLVLVLSPALVFSIINPSILDLSLNLPKLDLTAPKDPVYSLKGKEAIQKGLDPNSAIKGTAGPQAPASATNMSGPSSDNTYTDTASIPGGSWCFIKQGGSFTCSTQQSQCESVFAYVSSMGAAEASCKRY